MTYLAHFRHFVLLTLFIAALACNTGSNDFNSPDGAGPSVGKSVGGDSAINVEKSRPLRDRGDEGAVQRPDTLR